MEPCGEPGVEAVVDRLQPGEEDSWSANVLTGAHAVLGVLGLLGARQRDLQSRVVEETPVVRGVQWCGADVAANHQGECLVGSDDSLVGTPNRQVRAGTDHGSGCESPNREQRAP